jgi:hypothetical protein
MFKFLIFIGTIFLALGFYIEKENLESKEEKTTPSDDKLANIENRINEIEEILYSFEDRVNENKLKKEDIYDIEKFKLTQDNISDDEVLKNKGVPIDYNEDKFSIINSLVNGDINLTEACDILGMNKGEVLLLRNLYIESKN